MDFDEPKSLAEAMVVGTIKLIILLCLIGFLVLLAKGCDALGLID